MATQVETQTQLQKAGVSQVNHTQLSGIDLESSPATFFHQKIRSDTGQHKYSNSISFSEPSLGQDNRIYLPSIGVMPEQLVLEFSMGDASNAETGSDAKYMPTYFWIGNNGLRLLYKNTVVYHASQAEVEADFYLNNDYRELHRKQAISNDLKDTDRSGAAGLYYLDLQPLMKVFSHIGSLNSYDANAWSVEVDLKPAAKIIDGTKTIAGTGSISNLNLLIIGHQASSEFAMGIRNKLNSSGLMVQFLQSNFQRDEYAASATSKTVTLNQLEGNVSGMLILHRVKAGIDGAVDDKVKDTYQTFNGASDTIEVGRSSNPVELYGRAVPEKQVRLVLNGNKTFAGLPEYVDSDGLKNSKNIVPISMADKHSEDSKNGQSSGHMYVKNDLQFTYRWGTTEGVNATTANYVDTCVFIHRYLILRSDGVFSNNSY
jgi:hypothetical protein